MTSFTINCVRSINVNDTTPIKQCTVNNKNDITPIKQCTVNNENDITPNLLLLLVSLHHTFVIPLLHTSLRSVIVYQQVISCTRLWQEWAV